MIEIKPIQYHQISDVKRVILEVALTIYKWEESLEEVIQRFEENGELSDIDEYETHYLEKQGIFLVATDRDQVIGSGAIQKISEGVCELRRLWLLKEYQGKGLGYRIFQELIEYARENEYKRMWLETDYEQKRAIGFYERIGFYRIPNYNDRNSDVYMEMKI